MKSMVFSLLFILSNNLFAQTDSVKSGVYYWNDLKTTSKDKIQSKNVLKGFSSDLSSLKIDAVFLKSEQSSKLLHSSSDFEELLIVKEGKINVTVKNESKILGPGSIVITLPGDTCNVENIGSEQAAFYMMKYSSKLPMDAERGMNAGGSLIVDWNDLVFKAHDRGGIRQYFERPTAMMKRFEMHVTTLKAGIKSHEPHTHGAAEIVLIIDGNVEMQIGNNVHKAFVGDVIFLGSNVSHALKNIGKESCMYFAFQWE